MSSVVTPSNNGRMFSIDVAAYKRDEVVKRSKCADCATRHLCMIGGLPQVAAGIGPLVRERSFVQGEMLTREGHQSSHFRVLKVGMAFLCRDSAEGHARPLAVIARGTSFGGWSYLNLPEQLSVVAGTSGRFCEIATEKIRSMARNDRTFRDRLTRGYAEKMGTLAKWSEAMRRRCVAAQVAAALGLLQQAQQSTFVSIPSHTALAELLGSTRESIARALTTLETAGCVSKKSLRSYEVCPEAMHEWLATQT